jgi:hypothetical protein
MTHVVDVVGADADRVVERLTSHADKMA